MPKPRKIHEKNHETSALCNKYFRFGDHLVIKKIHNK